MRATSLRLLVTALFLLCGAFASLSRGTSRASLKESILKRKAAKAKEDAEKEKKDVRDVAVEKPSAPVATQAAKAIKTDPRKSIERLPAATVTQAAKTVKIDSRNLDFAKKVAIRVSAGGLAAAVALKGFQLAKTFLERRNGERDSSSFIRETSPKSKESEAPLDAMQDILDIFSASSEGFKKLDFHEGNSSKVVHDDSPSSLKGHSTILIFDCDSKLNDAADKKARIEYFTLMANLTSSVDPATPTKTVYIPGKGNKHIMEESSLVKSVKDWNFVSGSKPGMRVARAVRDKFGVKDEELRIIVLDETQEVTSENALDLLRINPRGMPWAPNSLESIMQGGEVLKGSGSNSTEMIKLNEPLAVYFSASWCAPCKKFTPKLASKYSNGSSETSSKLGGMEVLFVSLDSEEDQFNSYRTSMPWPAVPFRDPRRALLQMALGVKSIPALVIIDEGGRIITSSGVTQLMGDENMEQFPWAADVVDLDAGNGALVEALQRGPALIVLTDKNDKAGLAQALGAVSRASKKSVTLPRSPREDLLFCVLDNNSKLASAIRSLANMESNSKSPGTSVVLLDLGSEQFSVMPASATGSMQESVATFARNFKRYAIPLSKIAIPQSSADAEEQ